MQRVAPNQTLGRHEDSLITSEKMLDLAHGSGMFARKSLGSAPQRHTPA
jgi:hypothetical protein